MVDTLSPEQRSRIMRAVATRNTKPELAMRRILHAMGYRFRLHRRDLPGTPDIIFPTSRKVIFVHGCFWHSHGCSKGRAPKSRLDYWKPKLDANRDRDAHNVRALIELDWEPLTVWACELGDEASLAQRLKNFLDVEISIDKPVSAR